MRHIWITLLVFTLLAIAESAEAAPHILTRRQWGADHSLLFQSAHVQTSAQKPTTHHSHSTPSKREQECNEWRRLYPEDYKTTKTQKHDHYGKAYRWPLRYSSNVKLFVVHHTASEVQSDARSPRERMRALYTYHAKTLGWGDIGYHYVIAENGEIYEGRMGGKGVVAGHAYCANVNTLGIALMGNFEEEKPAQTQITALQNLIAHLAEVYGIDLQKTVQYRGRGMSPIVPHRDLGVTECAGHHLNAVLAQVRRNVIAGNLDTEVIFPIASHEGRKSRRFYRSRKTTRKTVSPKLISLAPQIPSSQSRSIRIRLSFNEPTATLFSRNGFTVNGKRITGEVRLGKHANRCALVLSAPPTTSYQLPATKYSSDILRITPATGTTSITNLDTYRGTIECRILQGKLTLINELPLEDYMRGLSEEPDSEPFEKQKAIAIAARSYAAHYMDPAYRKFPGMPYDGDDSAARFQKYTGVRFETANPGWVRAVQQTANQVLTVDGDILKAAYFSSSDGHTRSPEENGWKNFPFTEVFQSKPDPWCEGLELHGHGVGMSGCGSKAQANEGKTAREILEYYYPGTTIEKQAF